MTSENKPITPLTNQRASISLTDEQQASQQTNTEQPVKKTIKPRKNSQTTNPTKTKGRSFFLNTVVFITLIIAVFALFLAWKSTNNKWQIERVNELQTTASQLKSNLAALEIKLTDRLNQQINQPKSNAIDKEQFKQFNQQFNQQINVIKDDIATLSSRVDDKSALQSLSQRFEQQQHAQTDLKQELQTKLNSLQQRLASRENTTSKAILSISKLSNQQLHNWVLQINNQWLFEGDKIATANNLRALQQTVKTSNNVFKQSLLAKISQDQNTVESYQPPSIALEKIIDLKTWLASLTLSSANNIVSRETNQTSDTDSWQQLKNKFNELFSIRKKQSANELSSVETELEKRIIKQRMLLQAEQLGWAIHSQSPQIIHYAMEDISQLISQYAPDQLNTWQVKMIALMPSSQLSKLPLSITEINYVEHH